MIFKKIAIYLCLLTIISFFSVELTAAAQSKLTAQSALLINAENGCVLFKKNPDKPIQPASLTKILTLYLVYEAMHAGKINLSDMVEISTDSYVTSGSSMFLEEGDNVAMDDLIKGIAVVSGNDAAVAVAEYLGGNLQQFLKMMNDKASQLGMRHSRFMTPNGLPVEGQISTARDVALLARAYIRDFPESLSLHSIQSFTYNEITQNNNNVLLKQYPDVDGLKTGFVRAAGFHLIVTAKRGDTRLIAVVMGEKNPLIRAQEAAFLLDKGFTMTKVRKNNSSAKTGSCVPLQKNNAIK
jgi:D-alanyl-D-alanine carboxypeptidase